MDIKLKILPGMPAYFMGQDMRIASILVESAEIRVGAGGQLETYYKSGGEQPILVPEVVCAPSVETILESLLPVEMSGWKISIMPPSGTRQGPATQPTDAASGEVVHEGEISQAPRRGRAQKSPEPDTSVHVEPVHDPDDNLFRES